MLQGLIGIKLEQTQKFLESGRRIAVTEISVTDNTVMQVKTAAKDKYSAVQLGFGVKKNTLKPLAGHAKKAGLEHTPAMLKEVKFATVSEDDLPKAGDVVSVGSVFKPGDIVAVTGTSKGKGFAGVVKRYNFRGGPKTHGQSDRHRAPGSIGQTTTPGRVYRGKKMAGHMGVEQVTVKNLKVVAVDDAKKMLYVAGLVPGHRKGYLFISKLDEDKKFVPLLIPIPEVVEEVAAPVEEKPTAAVEETPVVSEEAAKEAKTEEGGDK